MFVFDFEDHECAVKRDDVADLAFLEFRCDVFERLRQLSLDELSALTGLSKPQLSRIETGDRQPSVGALMQIAKALGTNPGQLLAENLVRSRGVARAWTPIVGDIDVTASAPPATSRVRSWG